MAFAEDFSAQPPVQGLASTAALPPPSEKWLPLGPEKKQDDLQDHQANVFEIAGEARILKHGTDSWAPLQKDMIIEPGDRIVTGAHSTVRIAYDGRFLNIVMIKENSKAEFRSIEPTDLHLEDGSVFSVIDKLNGDTYQISTPTAVAAVRGTHFQTAYNARSGEFSVNLYPDGREASHVVVTDLEQGQEGNLIELSEGEKLVAENDNAPMEQEFVETMTGEEISEYQQEMETTLENTEHESSLEEIQESGISEDPSEGMLAEEGTLQEEAYFEDATSLDYVVDEAMESELGEMDLLGGLQEPETSTAGEQVLDSTTDMSSEESETGGDETLVEENVSGEEVAEFTEQDPSGVEETIPEPDVTEFLYEPTVEEFVDSLQDEMTSEQAAESEQSSEPEETTETDDSGGHGSSSESGH